MNKKSGFSRRALLCSPMVAAGGALIADASAYRAYAAETFPPTVQNAQSSLYVATNTTFGTAFVSGTYVDCAVVFTAPPTGRVIVHWSGAPRNLHTPGGALAYISFEVRTGGTIGSGTVVLPAANERTVRTNLTGSTTAVAAGSQHLLAGLIPASTYNARLLHRVTSQTGEFFHRGIIVEPVP